MRYGVCKYTCVHTCMYKSSRAVRENEHSPETGVTYKQAYTMA